MPFEKVLRFELQGSSEAELTWLTQEFVVKALWEAQQRLLGLTAGHASLVLVETTKGEPTSCHAVRAAPKSANAAPFAFVDTSDPASISKALKDAYARGKQEALQNQAEYDASAEAAARQLQPDLDPEEAYMVGRFGTKGPGGIHPPSIPPDPAGSVVRFLEERQARTFDVWHADAHQGPSGARGDQAFIPGLGTVRECLDCGCLIPGGLTRCKRCVDLAIPAPPTTCTEHSSSPDLDHQEQVQTFFRRAVAMAKEQEDRLIEALAAYALRHWMQQMKTSYDQLPETEKENGRMQARRILEVIRQHATISPGVLTTTGTEHSSSDDE